MAWHCVTSYPGAVRSFWFEIEELGDVPNKLDGILKMAEANTASLSEVFSRWESLYTHLGHILGMPRDQFEAIRASYWKTCFSAA